MMRWPEQSLSLVAVINIKKETEVTNRYTKTIKCMIKERNESKYGAVLESLIMGSEMAFSSTKDDKLAM